MTTAELLAEALSRVKEVVHAAASGLTTDQLAYQPQPGANSIGWLLWHLTRVQDDHVSEVAGTEQVWTADGWEERFALPYETEATGWSQEAGQVGQFSVSSASLLTGYYDAVHERSLAFIARLSDSDLDKVVDERWDPPVTLGVRLVSVIDDDTQHAGQAAYVRGLVVR